MRDRERRYKPRILMDRLDGRVETRTLQEAGRRALPRRVMVFGGGVDQVSRYDCCSQFRV